MKAQRPKGDRKNWTPVKEAASVKLSEIKPAGRKLSSKELKSRGASKNGNYSTVLVP